MMSFIFGGVKGKKLLNQSLIGLFFI